MQTHETERLSSEQEIWRTRVSMSEQRNSDLENDLKVLTQEWMETSKTLAHTDEKLQEAQRQNTEAKRENLQLAVTNKMHSNVRRRHSMILGDRTAFLGAHPNILLATEPLADATRPHSQSSPGPQLPVTEGKMSELKSLELQLQTTFCQLSEEKMQRINERRIIKDELKHKSSLLDASQRKIARLEQIMGAASPVASDKQTERYQRMVQELVDANLAKIEVEKQMRSWKTSYLIVRSSRDQARENLQQARSETKSITEAALKVVEKGLLHLDKLEALRRRVNVALDEGLPAEIERTPIEFRTGFKSLKVLEVLSSELSAWEYDKDGPMEMVQSDTESIADLTQGMMHRFEGIMFEVLKHKQMAEEAERERAAMLKRQLEASSNSSKQDLLEEIRKLSLRVSETDEELEETRRWAEMLSNQIQGKPTTAMEPEPQSKPVVDCVPESDTSAIASKDSGVESGGSLTATPREEEEDDIAALAEPVRRPVVKKTRTSTFLRSLSGDVDITMARKKAEGAAEQKVRLQARVPVGVLPTGRGTVVNKWMKVLATEKEVQVDLREEGPPPPLLPPTTYDSGSQSSVAQHTTAAQTVDPYPSPYHPPPTPPPARSRTPSPPRSPVQRSSVVRVYSARAGHQAAKQAVTRLRPPQWEAKDVGSQTMEELASFNSELDLMRKPIAKYEAETFKQKIYTN
ncbi:hypothetical protein CYMTET_42659 [Cymbomonas tetramitiformis]|uniref:Uncharacterized protein n=1 Tax=Cymbomonas tetramitiformis TaxID=36881 RepID=A0AAE0C3R4_9CHLO|nr:hypothetical protein CYMTET_42659 [Cymbomonas tetramitiformis]